MIKKTKIRNFKTHRRTDIDFHPGMNAFIGLPNAGKSNIRRALEWIATNRPRGFGFHSDFTSFPSTMVQVTTTEGNTIKLKKNLKSAEYSVNKDTYRKFGTAIPDKIAEAIKLSDINFTDQHDPPFLVTSSPAEIARTINKATNIDNLTKCIQFINKHIYNLKQKKNVLAANEATSVSNLKRFAGLDKSKRYIEEAKTTRSRIEHNQSEIDEITNIKESIESLRHTLQHKDKLNRALEYIERASQIKKQIEKNYSELANLESIIQLRSIIRTAKREKTRRIREFTTELKKQKRCPMCLSKITPGHIHNIKQEIK